LTLTLLVAGAALLGAQEPAGKRRPVPDKAAQVAVQKVVNEIFADDFQNAKDEAAKLRLAAELLRQARDNRKDDLPAAYVLYVEALDLAASAGDYQLAFQAIDELAAEFAVAALDLKARALATATKAQTEKDANRAIVDVALGLIGQAVDSDNYPAAAQFATVAEAAAKRVSVALVSTVRKRNDDILTLQKNFARLQPFIDRLKQNPKDGEANLKLGEYYGLLKGKWDKALPFLALGADEVLKAQARMDLANPKQGKEQLAVADGWHDLAEKHKDPIERNMLRRALFWYEQVAQNATGLSRSKALKRVDKISARLEGSPTVVVKTGPVGPIYTLKGHTSEVHGVAFSHDGRYGVSGGGKDTSVRVWDLTTGKELKDFRGHTQDVWDVAFHPNGRQVFSASWDKTVKLWDITTGREVRTFTHPLDVNAVAVTRDGKWLLTGSDDKNARLWDLTTGQEVKRFGGHEDYVYGVAFSHDGRHIATGSKDTKVRIFDLATGQRVREISGQSAPSTYVAFALDDKHVFSCGDTAAHLWDVATGKQIRQFAVPGTGGGYVLGMALSTDGRRLLTGHEDKTVRLWDTTTGKELQRFEGHTDRVISVAFSHDGTRALSGGADGTVRLWGLPSR
jgi:WD40 repeat protein